MAHCGVMRRTIPGATSGRPRHLAAEVLAGEDTLYRAVLDVLPVAV